MNFIRKNFYFITLIVITAFIGMILAFREKEPEVPPLKNRTGGIALGAEWINTQQSIQTMINDIRSNPEDGKLKLQLAQAYIQEARITGDYNYYDLASIKLLKEVLKKEKDNYEATSLLATVYLSQHHFQDGLALGRKIQKQNPRAAFPYGILTDAYVELGMYDSAVWAVDSMCAVRPDLRSYSRISYIREIYGDYPGAIEAMKLAVDAGYPGLEQTSWVRTYLGKLYEITGHLDSASFQYQLALIERPNYAFAIAGLGRIERINKNYSLAIKHFEQANALINEYSFGEELIDLYRLNNEIEKSNSMSKEVIALLQSHANTEDEGDAGHYADMELANVYLKTGEQKLALRHALAEYERRPDNIEVNELLAWIHFQRDEFAQSIPFIESALRTGSQNATLLARAGLIFIKTNQKEKGAELIQKALYINPYLPEDLMKEIHKLLPAVPVKNS